MVTNKFNINETVVLDGNMDRAYTVKGMCIHVMAVAGEKVLYKLNNYGDNDIFPSQENVHEDRMNLWVVEER